MLGCPVLSFVRLVCSRDLQRLTRTRCEGEHSSRRNEGAPLALPLQLLQVGLLAAAAVASTRRSAECTVRDTSQTRRAPLSLSLSRRVAYQFGVVVAAAAAASTRRTAVMRRPTWMFAQKRPIAQQSLILSLNLTLQQKARRSLTTFLLSATWRQTSSLPYFSTMFKAKCEYLLVTRSHPQPVLSDIVSSWPTQAEAAAATRNNLRPSPLPPSLNMDRRQCSIRTVEVTPQIEDVSLE